MSDTIRQVKVHHSGLPSLDSHSDYLHTHPYCPCQIKKFHHRYTNRLVSELHVEYEPQGTTKRDLPFSELISLLYAPYGFYVLCGEAPARGTMSQLTQCLSNSL